MINIKAWEELKNYVDIKPNGYKLSKDQFRIQNITLLTIENCFSKTSVGVNSLNTSMIEHDKFQIRVLKSSCL